MECTTCTELETAIQKEKDHDLKKALEKDLEDHWRNQEQYRDHYAATVTKAIANADCDMCMHVDGGCAGSEYAPYYVKDIARGEPFPHKCLKVG